MTEPRTFEFDVHAGIDQVWAALTTAEGLTSWFVVEADVDLTPGGTVRLDWGTGMEAFGEYVAVEPPTRLRLVYGYDDGEPSGGEEWLLSHDQGVTHVRLINSLPVEPGSTWDDTYPDIVRGWKLFTTTLAWVLGNALPLTRRTTPVVADLADGAWARVLAAAGLDATPEAGARIATSAGDAEVLVGVDGYSLLLAYGDAGTLLVDVEGPKLYTLAATYGAGHPDLHASLEQLARHLCKAAAAVGE